MEDINHITEGALMVLDGFPKFDIKQEEFKEQAVHHITDRKNQKVTILKQFGKFKASQVELEEYALNHQVLRVPLPVIDIKRLPAREVSFKFRSRKIKRKLNVRVSRFGRKLKKKTKDIPPNMAVPQTSQRQTSSMNASFEQERSLMNESFEEPMTPQSLIEYVPNEPTFYLQMPFEDPQSDLEDGKLQFPFGDIARNIKNLQLPSETWKIKVEVVSNSVTAMSLTNNCVLERMVRFEATSDYYQIVIDNKAAILLGSPNEIENLEDIGILLNIINNIDPEDCMLFYKK